MSSLGTPPQRLLLARQLIREKGLSRADLELLEDILREGAKRARFETQKTMEKVYKATGLR